MTTQMILPNKRHVRRGAEEKAGDVRVRPDELPSEETHKHPSSDVTRVGGI